MFLNANTQLNEQQEQLLNKYVIRRLNSEPMSYIQNYKDFWSLRFTVTKDTLIPRPETELIIDTALKLFPDKKAEFNILDLGTVVHYY